MLGDMLRPALREGDFTVEKKVILEEIAMYQDQPFWKLYEAVCAARYGGHGLGHRVLGTEGTVGGLTAGQMREYFTARYSADNTVVAFAGKVDFDRCVEGIAARCGGWERTGAGRDGSGAPMVPGRLDLRDRRVSRCYQLGLAPAPGATDGARYAASMLAMTLGDPDNGRLYWALVEPGLADEAHFSY